MKYVVVQRTGFLPYFLSSWGDGTDRWDCHVDQACVFNGPAARRIAEQLNNSNPGRVVPVTVETIR